MTNGNGDGGNGKGGGDKKNMSILPSSPLYLHPSDSPSLKLTHTEFVGNNYAIWADAVCNGLDAKNKLGFIDGSVTKPSTGSSAANDMEAVAWRQCQAMIRAWLRGVIDPKLHSSISFNSEVKEIWDELRERYSVGNAPRVHQLKSDLHDCRLGKQSVVEYYTRLKTIWDELANHSTVPPCTCGAAAALAKEKEEERVHQFLLGLDSPIYQNVRTNLLMEDKITSLSRAYAIVLREERHSALTRGKEEHSEAAMAVQVNSGGRGSSNTPSSDQADRPVRCTHCKKWYHTKENCWEKHGYPSRGRGRGRRGGGRGYGRGGRGYSNNFETANAATANEEAQSTEALTSTELQQLRAFLNAKSEGSSKSSGMENKIIIGNWLLDSGASHHMTGRRNLLHDTWTGEPSRVGLPDGSHIVAREHGRDPSTRMQIGRGEHKEGIYFLEANHKAARTKVDSDGTLWHQRLGHPSNNILSRFSSLIGKDLDRSKDKFNERGVPCVFIGYPKSKKGWKLYDPKPGKFFESRDVIFYENTFPFKDKNTDQKENIDIETQAVVTDELFMSNDESERQNTENSREEEPLITKNTPDNVDNTPNVDTMNSGQNSEDGEAANVEQELGRGARNKIEPYWKKDYVCKSTRIINPEHNAHPSTSSSSKAGTRYPLANYVNTSCFSSSYKSFLAVIDAVQEPKNYHEAAMKDVWKKAMAEEIKALEINGTWKIVDLPRESGPLVVNGSIR
ncbi:uncharacterized protein LOC141620115 [Silene latifolia]|uniref:uncharacterized protein LOC141620115 n=1 Tax=Silene latifolia TaxID=37657 RepID=UPI003D779389